MGMIAKKRIRADPHNSHHILELAYYIAAKRKAPCYVVQLDGGFKVALDVKSLPKGEKYEMLPDGNYDSYVETKTPTKWKKIKTVPVTLEEVERYTDMASTYIPVTGTERVSAVNPFGSAFVGNAISGV